MLRYRLYRPVSKLLHKFNLHYAPPSGPPDIKDALGSYQAVHQHHWCKWCGLRGEVTTVKLKEMK